MDVEHVLNIISNGEGLAVEFKKATSKLPKNLFETIVAFLNRNGGTILLGVSDNGEILGVEENKVEQLSKNLVNLSNNPSKLDPVFLLQTTVLEIENKKIIHVFVPSSSQVHKTNGKIYDRSSDGDFVVSTHTKISELYTRKSSLYSENTIYPYLTEAHFESETVQKAKNLIRANRPAHPWLELSGLDFFKAAGLYREDLTSGATGFTLASLLLFGKEEAILSMLPHYKIEALVRKVDKERYDDRLSIRYNLMRAYESLMDFVSRYLPDKFHLEGDQRISLRENIFRELIVNFLIHREYINPRSSTFEINKDSCSLKNANKPHLYGALEPSNCESFPKNPHLAKFFVQIGRAEELGTGIRKVFKYSKLFTGKSPVFNEADLFEVIVPVIENTTKETGLTTKETRRTTKENFTDDFTDDFTDNFTDENPRLKQIVFHLYQDDRISMAQLATKLNVTKRTIASDIAYLKTKGIITRIGNNKTGYWKLIKNSWKK